MPVNAVKRILQAERKSELLSMYRIFLSLLLLILFACGDAGKVPEGILSKEQMRDVLLDMNLADAYSSDMGDARIPVTDSVRQLRNKVYYRQILDLHGITVQQFMESYQYYEAHPDRLKEVYGMMLEVATARRSAMDDSERLKHYASDVQSLLPFGKKAIISGVRDTVMPFVKRAK